MPSAGTSLACIVGSILFVSTLVGVFAVAGVKPEAFTTRVNAQAACGLAGWGTGDEKVRIRHVSGRVLELDHVQLWISADGQPIRAYTPNPETILGHTLEPGESWDVMLKVRDPTSISIQLVHHSGLGSWVLWRNASPTTDCGRV